MIDFITSQGWGLELSPGLVVLAHKRTEKIITFKNLAIAYYWAMGHNEQGESV